LRLVGLFGTLAPVSWVSIHRWVLIAGLCAGAVGCGPTGDRTADEENDPHFKAGMARKQALDYAAAIESFEQALENNPRSAAAHFELGLICYQNVTNWAGAIYHLEQFCRLRPESNKADAARQFIAACKQELVREVPLGSISQQLQKEFAQLSQENKELRQQLAQLRQQLALRPSAGPTNPPGAAPRPLVAAGTPAGAPPAVPAPSNPATGEPPPERPRAAPSGRTHTVKAGETAYAIARRYGVEPAALLAANPGVDSRRLRIGQVLTLPRP
jgi:tetratricopeptide (TPR) repeat protein